ncbi:MAG TPA: YbaB/EbfC family nucleoid-associated protein [Candidatus Gastranaerophilales bacterium]|nr:YbaB/EbfC family nucleoid-associated protein [Candidatus Gastranaerophilales bacterium]
MKGFNIQQMMKQAQQMQKKMEDAQLELRNIEVTGEAGGGVISVVFNAKHEFKSIKIKPEALNPENPQSVDAETVEMLEDLITSAIKEANFKACKAIEQKMNSVTGGMGLNLPPGLF